MGHTRNRLRVVTLLAFAASLGGGAVMAQQGSDGADRITGEWITGDDRGRVRIERCGVHYCGILLRVEVPGVEVPLDVNNPEPSLRARKLEGLRILDALAYQGDSIWGGGEIYDPDSGNTYKVRITLVGTQALRLRGYVGIPLFGRSETWKRAGES
jgi:uncharacterized protein (DUF2147 family)